MNVNNFNKINHGIQFGEHFVVRNEQLEVRNHRGFWSKIIYIFTKKKEEAAVKELISKTVVELFQQREAIGGDDAFRTFMFEKMAPLTKGIFDRRIITKEIANVLDPTLKEYQKGLDKRIQKTFLAQKLGIDLKLISRGNSGSYFARDYKLKVIGVFKPSQEESLGTNTPKLLQKIKYLFLKHVLKIDTAAPFWPNLGYLSEVMSGKCAEHMGISILPPSTVTSLKSQIFTSAKGANEPTEEIGSYQVFVKDTKSADEAFNLHSMGNLLGGFFLKLNVWRYKDRISKVIDQKQFEDMVWIDYVICNRDRHNENFLIKNTPNVGKQRDIVLIDHNLSFPKENPPKRDLLYRRNQYKWAGLPQAEKPFSAEMHEIAKKFKGDELNKLINSLREINPDFTKLTDTGSSQEIAFKKRIAVLHYILEEGKTINELASIKSREEIDAFLNERQPN